MNVFRMSIAILRGVAAGIALACSAISPAAAQAPRGIWERQPDEIRTTLDSLARLSAGSFVHFVVGSCPGGRCEERVSIYRTNAEDPYVYRAASWVDLPTRPRFYGANRELPDGEAGSVLADARLAGVLSLLPDSIAMHNRSPRFWLRARFGSNYISIDGASLASSTYGDSTAARATYDRLREALVAPLAEQYRSRE